MPQQHDRGAGGWQAEWGTLSDLLTLVGSAAAWTVDLLANLEVDVSRMREHAAGLEGDTAAVDSLIDRALAAAR
jgi:3-carboxy-cis,cis-muconate cycloisomerase